MHTLSHGFRHGEPMTLRLLGEDVMGNLTAADCIIGSSSLPLLVVSTLSCDFEVPFLIAESISTPS